ncbi:WSSV530 [White spot syndrome virus]|uniref:WSSV530 n=1 Tax=White spot syndrome virus TaxID=342409 RepID=A0A2I6SCI1_9VIRU|nr:WSSV530 [White spot syndrome virus]
MYDQYAIDTFQEGKGATDWTSHGASEHVIDTTLNKMREICSNTLKICGRR